MMKIKIISLAALMVAVSACGSQVVEFPGDNPIDAGVADSKHQSVDTGIMMAVDSGTPVVDTGMLLTDTGVLVVDTGTPVVDSGVADSTCHTMVDSAIPFDSAMPDTTMVALDSAMPDSMMAMDSSMPDSMMLVDSSLPDIMVAMDSNLPDVSLPDTSLPDTMLNLPDVVVEATVEASLPEASVDAAMACNTPAPSAVNLGTAGGFAILTKSGISTVPNSVITGNIGVSPIAASAITGFALIADSSNTYSTSTQVIGKVYAADYSPPTPSNMTTAVSDMQTAFTDAAGRAPSVTELGAGNIGGMMLSAGVYKWSTGLLIPTNVTLQGNCGDVWIFEIAQGLTLNSNVKVLLSGGAQAKNIFWQVSGAVTVGTTAHLEGIVLTQTAVAMDNGASINGRLLAQTAVTLNQNVVTQP